ncbi:MAG: hypothetical protein ACYCUZ_05250 [Cuniculiplasma sp.]
MAVKINQQQRWLFKNASKEKFEKICDIMVQEAVKNGKIARKIAVRKKNPTEDFYVEVKTE